MTRDARRWLHTRAEHRWEHRPHGELNGPTRGIIGPGHRGLERIKELSKWGDLTRAAYPGERNRLEAEPARRGGASERVETPMRATAFLPDPPAAWGAETPEQRHALARVVFRSVEVADDRVTAVVPKPDVAPFFNVAAPDGAGTARGSLDRLPPSVSSRF